MSSLPSWHLRLPPFLQVALRVLQLTGNENVPPHELSELISSDPAFASEVLTIVNSMAYAPRFPISSILQAIAVMGANHLQGLCLTVGVRSYIGHTLRRPWMRTLWRHNLACAIIAEQLASTGCMDRDVAFTAGVMHDIGRLALAAVHPAQYTELLETHAGPPESILDRERHEFGLDHCALGGQLVADWRLPREFEPIVAEHHTPHPPDAPWSMTDLIHVSCRMADTAGFAAFPACQVVPFEELLQELPGRVRRLFFPEVKCMAFEITRKIKAIEAL